jgi:hypothetical protein
MAGHVPLQHAPINHDFRMKKAYRVATGVDQDRDCPSSDDGIDRHGVFDRIVDPASYALFDLNGAGVHGIGKANLSTHCHRHRQFADDYRQTQLMQAQGHAAGEVASAPNKNEGHIVLLFF